MFIGHSAVAFALKRSAPEASLGALFTAALLPDLMFPFLVLAGREQVRAAAGNTAFTRMAFDWYPYSHGLLPGLLWAVALAVLYLWRTGYRAGAAAMAVGVVSHWLLDFISHLPDMPLYPGGPVFGLGLWKSTAATIVVEGLWFALGVWLYAGVTRSRDRTGTYAFAGLVAFLAVIYATSTMDTPPPSPAGFALVGLAGLLLPLWAWWADRHRDARRLSRAGKA